MATMTVEVQDLLTRWAEIISRVAEGAAVILTEGNVPRARLIPLSLGPVRVGGLHARAIRTADDFDAPLPEDFWSGAS